MASKYARIGAVVDEHAEPAAGHQRREGGRRADLHDRRPQPGCDWVAGDEGFRVPAEGAGVLGREHSDLCA